MVKGFLAAMLYLFAATAAAKSIVVLGDSISAGYGMEVQQSWVALLQEHLQQLDKNHIVHNESISGDTSAGGLARIDQILNQHHPDVLILELGANDGLRGLSPKILKNNLAEIIRRAQTRHCKVLLLSMRIPPNYGKRYVDLFYQVYPQLAESLGAIYVPFILQDVALVNELMQHDGLHPNHKAQPLIAEKVWRYLQPLL
jgi:acyl-CoA thioesterase I